MARGADDRAVAARPLPAACACAPAAGAAQGHAGGVPHQVHVAPQGSHAPSNDRGVVRSCQLGDSNPQFSASPSGCSGCSSAPTGSSGCSRPPIPHNAFAASAFALMTLPIGRRNRPLGNGQALKAHAAGATAPVGPPAPSLLGDPYLRPGMGIALAHRPSHPDGLPAALVAGDDARWARPWRASAPRRRRQCVRKPLYGQTRTHRRVLAVQARLQV